MKKKKLFLQHGVTVGLIQCPDMHAMRAFHTLFAAQYLLCEALGRLPRINDPEYGELIHTLMEKRFENSDSELLINEKSKLKVVYDKVTSLFSHKKESDEALYCRSFLQQCQSDKQTGHDSSPSTEKNDGKVLVHCKAGMSRSATTLLSMYIFFIDIILRWHAKDFIHSEEDEAFFGAIIKALYHPSKDPINDVTNIVHIFSKNYRHITPLDEQILVLAQLIQYKRQLLITSELHYDGTLLAEENQETTDLAPRYSSSSNFISPNAL
ncbi:protein of unknown function [Legionella fallonii LLAP-10]|uniref:Tyrosine specific protein phosphatases domain-containing protein n=2 Tax=Legionella fallonii TaxID=96230 RepID=A0A098GAS5_9GAMM|nr:protein of unknown function [Legionella fallonii LLAP-10]